MGEAKRRANEIAALKNRVDAWRSGLTESERVILELAERIDARLVRGRSFTEGCYHLAFFMTKYLAIRGIEVVPVIGWVNDGTWPGVTSHAWIEYQGKVTDASLTLTSYPESQPSGALLVHDFIVRPGSAAYVYYDNKASEVASALQWISSQPQWADLQAFKEVQHASMLAIAQDERRIDEYLASAPLGGRYEDLERIVC
ncbi:hypothetical protein RQP54_17800 [Curvibacter sp. APW13]|uniref:hypothetical protein n=1 Tax=Curvibacter sp. APW13 TaxID=3077236 RepID=UPI0028DDB6A0|nr:hypothetical protein [Curvibacter sp. APW13]MDT8992731.1 hypothetical protein [Curvibacter sp. APW13]